MYNTNKFNTMSSEVLNVLNLVPEKLLKHIHFFLKVFGYWHAAEFQTFVISEIYDYKTTFMPQHPTLAARGYAIERVDKE